MAYSVRSPPVSGIPGAWHQSPGVTVGTVRANHDITFASRQNRERLHRRQEPIRQISVFYCILLALLCAVHACTAATAPSTVFDLRQWKLQIPGPKEIKNLKGYSSEYFHLNAEQEMRFYL